MADAYDVYLEVTKRRVLASAVDWPGWSRLGRDEASALQALFDHGPRYARALRGTALGFKAPTQVSALRVVKRLPGTVDTTMGIPLKSLREDGKPVRAPDLARYTELLKGCWRTFDAACRAAQGKKLRVGPRGGGRNLEKIMEHVLGAEEAYLYQLGLKFRTDPAHDLAARFRELRRAVPEAMRAAAAGEYPKVGPRGGKKWSPRYYVRRSAWHILDHAWEIEDRIT